jgi:hypothetical protein
MKLPANPGQGHGVGSFCRSSCRPAVHAPATPDFDLYETRTREFIWGLAPYEWWWYADRMTTYRTARVDDGLDWVVIATRDDNSQESLTRHSNEVEAEAMMDRLTAITVAKVGA